MKIIVYFLFFIVGFFLLCIASTIFGAAVGWSVGLFFDETILGFLQRVGVDTEGLEMWQVGAALGFIGSFFRSLHAAKNK